MTNTAATNASNSNAVVTDDGACVPVSQELVVVALALVNGGSSALTIDDVFRQTPRPSYGPIASDFYDTLVGQIVPANGSLLVQWSETYQCTGGVLSYGIDLILQMSDGSNVTPAVAPGSINVALATVIAANVIWFNGIQFTATAHGTGNVGGVGAPNFDIGSGSDTVTATNLAAAVNQMFGANSATSSTTNVIALPPVITANNASGTFTITSALTIDVASDFAVGDQITIAGRQTAGAGGALQTYTFTATSIMSQTGGTGAPQFYAGSSDTAYATNLAAAIVAMFGTSTAAASGTTITLGATFVSGDFGVGANLSTTAPSLTVSAGTNVVQPQPLLFQITPGTEITPVN